MMKGKLRLEPYIHYLEIMVKNVIFNFKKIASTHAVITFSRVFISFISIYSLWG